MALVTYIHPYRHTCIRCINSSSVHLLSERSDLNKKAPVDYVEDPQDCGGIAFGEIRLNQDHCLCALIAPVSVY